MPPAFWLFLRCVLWGLATGAAAGAVVGALIGAVSDVEFDGAGALAVIATAIGAGYGTVFAIVPSVVGGLVVTEVTRRRHPQPASPPAVRRDLGIMFASVALLMNAIFFPAMFVTADENAPIGAYLVGLLAANVAGAPVLWWARSSITKSWAGSSR